MHGPTNTHSSFAAAALIAALLALLCPPAASAAAGVERVGESASSVLDHWTAARMRAAEPAPAPSPPLAAGRTSGSVRGEGGAPSYVPAAAPGDAAGAGIRTGAPQPTRGPLPGDTRDEVTEPAAAEVSAHGKVFFTIPSGDDAGDYVCSGTAVNSRNRSVVWTAGHCVLPETSSSFVTNWVFVPAHSADSQPYGEWTAKRLATTGPWQESRNIKYDLGAAVVRRAEDSRLGDVVGGRGIGFDQPRDQLYRAFGYPAVPSPLAPEFDGDREFRCTSRPLGTDNPGTSGPPTTSIECDMTGGSSGGGWIVDSTLLSVTSYGYQLELDALYGPYMSTEAKSLYRQVRGKPKRKKCEAKKGGGKRKGKGCKKGGKRGR
jgi:V8-like Glu-specific endopeptidase